MDILKFKRDQYDANNNTHLTRTTYLKKNFSIGHLFQPKIFSVVDPLFG